MKNVLLNVVSYIIAKFIFVLFDIYSFFLLLKWRMTGEFDQIRNWVSDLNQSVMHNLNVRETDAQYAE